MSVSVAAAARPNHSIKFASSGGATSQIPRAGCKWFPAAAGGEAEAGSGGELHQLERVEFSRRHG